MIERDENYLEDLVIDCLSESSQTKIIEKKAMLDKSKQDLETFKKLIREHLEGFYEIKAAGIKPEDRQNLITICYTRSGIDILTNFEQW